MKNKMSTEESLLSLRCCEKCRKVKTLVTRVQSNRDKKERLPIYRNEKKRTTTAVIDNASYDAVDHIIAVAEIKDYSDNLKLDVAKMNDKYTGTVTCHNEDVYDKDIGESEAVKKVMSNHNKAFKKALKRWQVEMLKTIIKVSPDTFMDALHEFKLW